VQGSGEGGIRSAKPLTGFTLPVAIRCGLRHVRTGWRSSDYVVGREAMVTMADVARSEAAYIVSR